MPPPVPAGEWDRAFPVSEMFHVYEAWRWAPLSVTPHLYEQIFRATGQITDCGWHYQDNRPWFTDGHWASLGRFIEHFTALDGGL